MSSLRPATPSIGSSCPSANSTPPAYQPPLPLKLAPEGGTPSQGAAPFSVLPVKGSPPPPVPQQRRSSASSGAGCCTRRRPSGDRVSTRGSVRQPA